MTDTTKLGDLTVITAASIADPTHPINTTASSQYNGQPGLQKKLGRQYLRDNGGGDYDIAIPVETGPTGAWLKLLHPQSVVLVKTLADFPAPVDGRIPLDIDTVYMIDGSIDPAPYSLEIPEGGASITGVPGGRDVSILTCSGSDYTLFVSPVGGYSGNVLINELTITIDGTNSQVFDLDNNGTFGAVDITGINYLNCTSLGELTDYRQLLNANVGYAVVDDGYTFNGTWAGGIAVIGSIAFGTADFTLFQEGTSLTFAGSVRSDLNFLGVTAGSVLSDFQPANVLADGGFSLTNVRTTVTDPLPNFSGSSVKARFRDCLGIRNTYVGGEFTVSSSAATDLSSAGANVLVKAAGTMTYADLQWFNGDVDNAFEYESAQEIEVDVQVSASFSGSNNDVLGAQMRLWDDSASAYVNIGARFTATLNSAGNAENLTLFARAFVNVNDRIELWIENQTGARDITLLTGGFVGIEERPS